MNPSPRSHLGRWRSRPHLTLGWLVTTGLLLGITGVTPALALPADTVTYAQDTSLVLSGVPVTLTVLAGSSHGSSLSIGTTSFTLPASIVGHVTVRYTGSSPKKFTDGATTYCTYASGNNDYAFTSAHVGKTISISAETCGAPSSGGGGGYTQPYGGLTSPNGGQILNAGSQYQILWTAGGTGITGIRLSLSTDGGATYPTVIAASASNSSYYYWIVPDVSTMQAKVKMEVLGSTISDLSNAVFTIVGSAPMPTTTTTTTETTTPGPTDTPTTPAAIAAAEAAAPATDANVSGAFNPTTATGNTPTINVDKSLQPPPPDRPALCMSGTLIKGSLSAVYFCGKDGRRYVFVNEEVFKSWYNDFLSVITIPDATLAQIPLGGNVTYKPGVRLLKLTTDPKVYAVARSGVLRWVQTEIVALRHYGADWNKMIDDVSDAFFLNYRIGDPIAE